MSACDERLDLLAQEVLVEESSEKEVLWREYVNTYLSCYNHPERNTTDSAGLRALAEEIFASFGDRIGQVGVPVVTEEITAHQLQSIVSGNENPSNDPAQEKVQFCADPVMMFNGQFVHEVEDISISGAGIDFVFRRVYKNQIPFDGPLGFNWTHNLHTRLRVAHQTIFRSTGDLREEAFIRHPKFGEGISDDFDYWVPPDGEDSVIYADGNSFVLRLPNGMHHLFEQDPARPFLHRLRRIEDRHGNYLDLRYQDDLLLQVEINHPVRVVALEYDRQGRICLIRDYTGRQWRYAYDSLGDLIAVTAPATERYKCGPTVCYDYSSAFHTGALQHNLIRITDAGGQIYLENEYGIGSGLLEFNRVVRQRQGGGEYRFEYEDLVAELDFDYPDEQRPAHQTTLVERNGQTIHHVYNKSGNLLLREQCVLQSGVTRTVAEHFRYNRDGNVVASLTAEGVLTQHLYGRDYFIRRHGLTANGKIPTDALTWRERQAFGRILSTVHRDGYARFGTFSLTQGLFGNFPDLVSGIFPAGMGKREHDVIVKYTYESDYGQLRTASDPRFTNSADPGALNEHPRYGETLTEYLYDGPAGDPNCFLVEIRRPVPTHPDGTQGPPVVEEYRNADTTPAYDQHGRLLRHVNPVGVVTEHTYFPEDPADPREGNLQHTVIAPADAAITTEYEVDPLGRVVAVHFPRSVTVTDDRFVTRTAYDELDQIIQTTTSLPFEFKTRRFYDRSGKLERVERELKDEDGNDILGGVEVSTYCYDEEFNLVRESMGGAHPSARLVTKHRYDAAGQWVLTVLPEGNQIRYRHDERLLPVAETVGAGTGEAATTRTEYDGDGRVRRTFDARGNGTVFTRDAFGRIIAEENALGHIVRRNYDKLGNVTVERAFEKRPDGYYLLARNEAAYDELGRAIRTGTTRFDEPPGPLPPGQLATAFLSTPVPSSSLLVTQTFYDAQGRVTKTVDPLQRESTYEYDELDRVRVEADTLGNRTISHYDEHSNLVRRDRIGLERDPNDPSIVTGQRVFSSSFTYDELDRMASSTDSLGNVTAFFYDSRDNQVRRVDPLGNVVRMSYDIHNRRIAESRELTDTGVGGGALVDTATTRFAYDTNDNLLRVTDALGRRMRYVYDALDRRRATIYPDDSQFTSDYDPDGNLTRTTDNNGVKRHYTVDALGRTTRVDVDTSGPSAVQVEGATFEQYAYDGLDRSFVEENDFARCETRFNSLGWTVADTITFTTPAAPLGTPFTINREFNDVGALAGLTYPNGRQLHFDRDGLDRLTGIQNVFKGTGYSGSAATPGVHDIVADMEYAGLQKRRCLYGNGAITTYHHDGAARLIEIDHASSTGPLLRIQYLYDAVGNVRIRHDITPASNLGEAFAYDSLNRLADEGQATPHIFDPVTLAPSPTAPPDPIPNGQAAIDTLIGSMSLPPEPHTYDYDLVGNRKRETDGSEIAYEANALDQYVKIDNLTAGVTAEPEYDASGNLKDDDQRTYTYDSLNRLVKVSEGGIPIAEFFHDARGRRILESVDGNRTQLIHDGANLIAEYRNGPLFAQYVQGEGVDQPQQIAAEGSEHWYHTDLVGSVRLLTNQAGSGEAAYRYTPFGKLTLTPVDGPYNPLRYTARRLDERLDTYDYRARQYDPGLGRFMQRDPVESGERINFYLYSQNNPMAFVDPFGTERKEAEYNRSLDDQIEDFYKDQDLRADLALDDDLDPAFDEASAHAWMLERARHGLTTTEPAVTRAGRAVGAFAEGVIVEGGGWWVDRFQEAGSTLAWGIGGTLDLLVVKPIDYLESKLGGPGSLAYNPVGARVTGVRTGLSFAAKLLMSWRRGKTTADVVQRADPTFVPAYQIITKRIKGSPIESTYRGYDLRSPDTKRMIAGAQRWGGPLEGHVGHVTSQSILRPGEKGLVRWQSAAENLGASAGEKARVSLYRKMSKHLGLDPHDPANPWFTRPTPKKRSKKR